MQRADFVMNTDRKIAVIDGKVGFMLANLVLSSYQKKLAKQLDTNVGQEMAQGIQSAEETGATLVLADRNIQTTFMRIWRKMNLKEKFDLLLNLFFALDDEEENEITIYDDNDYDAIYISEESCSHIEKTRKTEENALVITGVNNESEDIFMRAIVTVIGKDRVGIIAEVCTDLAAFNVNVLDMVSAVYPVDKADEAFKALVENDGSLAKVLIEL